MNLPEQYPDPLSSASPKTEHCLHLYADTLPVVVPPESHQTLLVVPVGRKSEGLLGDT